MLAAAVLVPVVAGAAAAGVVLTLLPGATVRPRVLGP